MNASVSSTSLFTLALGLHAPWEVVDATFEPVGGRLDLQLGFRRGARFPCPHCGAEHQCVHDTLERTWRHLNFFQYQAHLHAKVPRVRCEACGKTSQVLVPWAREGSGFTLLMEALLVTRARRCRCARSHRCWRSVTCACGAPSITTSIRRGHKRISLRCPPWVWMRPRRGAGMTTSACSMVSRPDGWCSLAGRKAEVVDAFGEDLEAHGGCAENIQAVCVDMSASYYAGVQTYLPWAEITFDEFHVICVS